MTATLAIFWFELRFYLSRASTWVYWLALGGFTFLLMITLGGAFPGASAAVGGTDGNVKVNAPYVLALIIAQQGLFSVLVTAALAGHAGYRDFGEGMHPLIFTTPLPKRAWILGRYLGTVAVNTLVLTSIPVAAWFASLMPFVESERFMSPGLLAYVQPFVVSLLPNTMLTAALFFSIAAVTRSRLPHYVGGVGLLIGYLMGLTLMGDVETKWIAAMADPFGFNALDLMTEYWTTAEKNALTPGLTGWVLYNRLLWLGLGALGFAGMSTLIRFDHEGVRLWPGRAPAEAAPIGARPLVAPVKLQLPPAKLHFGAAAHVAWFAAVLRRTFREILANAYFGALLAGGVLFLVLNSSSVGEMYGTTTWPVTYAVLELLGGSFGLFVLIILTFYAGEMVWNERDLKVQQLVDTLPMPNWLPFVAKLVALLFMVGALQLVVLVAGILTQAWEGYTHFEVGLYLQGLYWWSFTGYAWLAVLALAIHTVVNHKYVGHFLMVGFYLFTGFMGQFGLEHVLMHYGADVGSTYSDMNGYTPYAGPFLVFQLYWGSVAVLLALLSNVLWVRGEESHVAWRMKLAGARMRRGVVAGFVVALMAVVGLGGFIVYNVNILNDYQTSWQAEEDVVRYERTYRKYLDDPQPRITDVAVEVDLYPYEGRADVRGTLTVRNKTDGPIPVAHLLFSEAAEVRKLAFDRPAEITLQDDDVAWRSYTFATPLQPGEKAVLTFDLGHARKGFSNDGVSTSIVENGTFVNSGELVPSFGYAPEFELSEDQTRKKHGLEPKERMADLDDEAARANTYIARDSDWVTFAATVSTSPDQIAIAPGYLKREWTEGDRRYFRYEMDSPILNFYSFLSARYEVEEDRWHDVAIQVFHHPGHDYNVERMIEATKKSLDLYTIAFSPYQHKQVRILEFPRYASFAQSFPNTIPYSESIGFIARVEDPEEDIDYPFYVTAHEVAHQWWAHQVIGADLQGSTLMSETLSQYSALLVMEHEYGEDHIHRFLKYELDSYLQGRAFERKKELPLIRVENQPYIHYNKGAIAMFALKDYIGEEALNDALRRYVEAVAWQDPPYTTSREFVAYLRSATPPELQYVIDDLFEHITLYENRAVSATSKPTADGRFEVKLTIDARKVRAGEQGEETPVALNDLIDVAVFGGEDGKKRLYLQKHRITDDTDEIVVVVDQLPVEAGIDPYYKLIDRHPDDNRVDVETE